MHSLVESGKKIHVVLEDHESLGARYMHVIVDMFRWEATNAMQCYRGNSIGRLPTNLLRIVPIYIQVL